MAQNETVNIYHGYEIFIMNEPESSKNLGNKEGRTKEKVSKKHPARQKTGRPIT
jgi:hypothetical protein